MTTTEEELQQIYNESIPFRQFWLSYFQMFLSPRKAMRLMNFGSRVIVKYKIDTE